MTREDPPSYLVDRTYRDTAGRFRFVLVESTMLAMARFEGRGSLDGTRAFAQMLDDTMALLAADQRVRAICDLSGLSKTPLRAQFVLGKWLFTQRHHCGRIAIFGAANWERRLAKAVFKIARLTDIGFFHTEQEAQQFLEVQVVLPVVGDD